MAALPCARCRKLAVIEHATCTRVVSPESAPPPCALGRPDCIGLPPCAPVAPDCIDRCSALRAWWPARTAWELRLARRVARTESVVRRVATCYVPRCGTGDLSCVSAASNKALDPKFHGEVQLEQAGRRVIRLQRGPRHWWRCALARRVAPCVGGGGQIHAAREAGKKSQSAPTVANSDTPYKVTMRPPGLRSPVVRNLVAPLFVSHRRALLTRSFSTSPLVREFLRESLYVRALPPGGHFALRSPGV